MRQKLKMSTLVTIAALAAPVLNAKGSAQASGRGMEDEPPLVHRCKTGSDVRSEPRLGPRSKNQGTDA